MPILSLRYANLLRILYAAGALAFAATAHAQTPTITTFAGGAFVNNAPALQSYIDPLGVAVDTSGNVYVADMGYIVRVAHSTGVLTAVAGAPPSVYDSSDGPALSVRLAPTDLVVYNGNVLFLDSSMLRQLNVQQATITTIAGQSGVNGSTGDGGPASDALLNMPQQFCLDSMGNIYIVELAGYVRRIDAQTHVITTIAGNGGTKFSGDGGLATAATLLRPAGIAVDSNGNLFIADAGDLRIREITAGTEIINTIAGNGNEAESGDGGSALKASFFGLGELGIDSHNNLYLIDVDRVRMISTSGIISTVAGNNTAGLAGDGGPAARAELNMPLSLALDSSNNLYIADTGNRRVRLVTASSGTISTIAGTSFNGDGGLAAGAVLNGAIAAAVDAAGDLFIAEDSRIREVTASTGIISTFAGGGTSTGNGVSALQAKLSPLSVVVDAGGNVIVGEAGLIVRIDTSGTVTSIAGTGVPGFSGDGGPAPAAQIGFVSALAVDSSGGVLFVDSGNRRVRRIGADGYINTIAGNGQDAFTGPGQSATATGIGDPTGVGVDANGNIFIGGIDTYYMLEIPPSGTLSIAGGIGGCGYIGDGGPATLAGMCQPSSFAADAGSNLYVGDTTCYCVRRIAADTGIIQTVAGNGTLGYSGDNGAATLAQLRSVSSVALFGSTLYVVDQSSSVVRAVTPDTPPALPGIPSFSSVVNSASFQTGPVAPGELITFYGNYLGPAAPNTWQLGSDGKLTIPNANVQIFFDDVPAPLVYISAGQINAVTPFETANGFSTVKIQTSGGTVSSSTIGSTTASPGIFPYAIVNEDGSLNSATYPAPAGTYVTMYGTGLGQTNPGGVDDINTPGSNLPTQIYTTGATISLNPLFSAPIALNVLYAGPAPGLAEGVCQIDAIIPTGAAPGQNFMIVSTGLESSPVITLWVQ